MDAKKIAVTLLGVLLGVGAFAIVQAGGGKCEMKKGCCMAASSSAQK